MERNAECWRACAQMTSSLLTERLIPLAHKTGKCWKTHTMSASEEEHRL